MPAFFAPCPPGKRMAQSRINLVIFVRPLQRTVTMSRTVLLLYTFLLPGYLAWSQSVTNGNFSSGTSGWGCGPEINTETTYGGSNGSNMVDEVDTQAGLCQTISGFIIGKDYYLSIDASRRTGGCPSPATTNMNVTISGGVLSATITRTNTTFGFVTSGFLFTANSTTHTINYAAGSGFGSSTCGMIVDNIVIAAAVLPIELTGFTGGFDGSLVNLYWSTATEKNNDHFDVERSENGTVFTPVATLSSKASGGNSFSRLDYSAKDEQPLNATAYYRLKQTDKDGTFSYSRIIEVSPVKKHESTFSLYPNPNKGLFYVSVKTTEAAQPVTITLVDQLGSIVHSESFPVPASVSDIKIIPATPLSPGFYYCLIHSPGSGSVRYLKVMVG